MALIEKALLSAANAQSVSDTLPDELKLYENDINLARLKVQLQMLPDVIRTRNSMGSTAVPIKEIANLRTLCDIMNEPSMSEGHSSPKDILQHTCYNMYCRVYILSSQET